MAASGERHVVHFTTVHPPSDTRIFHKELRTLADAGYRVTFVAPGAPPPALGGIEFVSLPLHTSRRERFARGTAEAARVLRNLDADLYHFHDPELLPLGGWLRARGKRVVYDAHESVHDTVAAKTYIRKPVAGLAARVARGVEQFVGRRLAHVVTATPTIAAQFTCPTTVVANYPLLDEWKDIESTPASFRARPQQGAYVGVITDDRCRGEMLAASALVNQARPEFRFVLAGTVDPPDLPLNGPGVEHVGSLLRPQVADLLGRCRFGVVMMRPLPNNVDGMPTKYFEYLIAGLPVIVSSSLREPVRITEAERCGLVVDDDDARGLADAMLRLLDDPASAYDMGERGRKAVIERYSWASEAKKLLGLYEVLLAGVRPSGGRHRRARPRTPAVDR